MGQNFERTMLKKNETINKNVMTQTEKENWINYDTLYKKWVAIVQNELNKVSGSFIQWRDLTLVSLFILIPPTRIGNYETMRIRFMKTNDVKSLKQDRNYLMINDNPEKAKYQLCFNKYKTAKFVGQTCEDITSKLLINVLDTYIGLRLQVQPINKYKFNDTDTLFINSDKKQLTQSYITETLKKRPTNILIKTKLRPI